MMGIRSLFFDCLVLCCSFGISLEATVNVDEPRITISENQRTSSLNVSFNETITGSNVSVVCEVVQPSGGASKIIFTQVIALIGQSSATVPYRIMSPGQPVTIQCSGQSQGNHTQFSVALSKGRPGILQVTQAPTVTICDNPFTITTDSGCLTVQVRLSEPVRGSFPAAINCSTTNTGSGGPSLKFEEILIKLGQSTGEVPFTVISKGTKTQTTQVTCKAQTCNATASSWFICGSTTAPTVAPVIPTTVPSTRNASNITTQNPLTVPTPSPPAVLNITRYTTSTDGVQIFQYLLDTSAGHPVDFVLSTPSLQFHPSSVTTQGDYSVILSLNSPLTVPLDLQCSLTLLPIGSVNASAIYCPDEPVTKVTLTSSSVQLQLVQTEIQFKKSEITKTLVVSINGSPSKRLQDLVQLSCCPQTTAVLKPPAVAMYIFVDVRRHLAPSSDSGTASSTSPLDIDLSCPCNMKQAQCDTSCCCDEDCSSIDKSLFSCIKGFYGGDSEERPFEFSCNASWPDITDLHPILCVTSTSSPLIGYWYNYTPPSSAKDLPEYKALLQSASRQTTFSYKPSTQTSSSSSGGYKLGTSIKTAANSKDNKYTSATLGTLALPAPVVNGLCSKAVPVRFLESTKSTCVNEVVDSLCVATSSLSASSYLMPRDLNSPPCPAPAAVLSSGTLSQNQNEQPELAEIEVQYFCTGDEKKDLSPWRCNFDDGKTAPPLPFLNQNSEKCSNVVNNVTYLFETSGQKVTKVRAIITIGDTSVKSQSYSNLATSEMSINTITQYFSTRFSIVSNSSNSSVISQRSGNPGYIRGLPVLALITSRNSSTPSTLLSFSSNADTLCTTSSTVPINFGESSTSGCTLKLTFDDMKNCTYIRELVLANQKALLNPTHVGRTGNARVTIIEDWVAIIRDTVKEPTPLVPSSGVCTDIPYGLVIEVLIAEAGRYKGVAQKEIVGLKMSYNYAQWQFYCVSGYGVGCQATDAASSNGSFVGNDTGLIGNSPNTSGNSPNTSYSSRHVFFSLETRVIFIEVPSSEPTKVKRSLDLTGICYQDVCKEELFYPLSPGYQGEPKDKVMAYFLLLVFMTLVTFTFTRPWG